MKHNHLTACVLSLSKVVLIFAWLLSGVEGPKVHAQANYLTVIGSAAEQSFALQSIKALTFTATDAVVTTTDGQQQTFPLADLSRFAFTSEPTVINSLQRATSDGGLTLRGTDLIARGAGRLTIYNAAGVPVMQQTAASGSDVISLRSLPRGLYIIQLGNETLKVIR